MVYLPCQSSELVDARRSLPSGRIEILPRSGILNFSVVGSNPTSCTNSLIMNLKIGYTVKYTYDERWSTPETYVIYRCFLGIRFKKVGVTKNFDACEFAIQKDIQVRELNFKYRKNLINYA